MKTYEFVIAIIFILAMVGSFGTWQYNETQRKFISDGYQHCPYKGAYGYYWAKECK